MHVETATRVSCWSHNLGIGMDTNQMGGFLVSIEIGENDKAVVIFAHVNFAVLPTRLIRCRVTPRTGQIEIGISERRKVNLDPISRHI